MKTSREIRHYTEYIFYGSIIWNKFLHKTTTLGTQVTIT